MIDWWVLPRLVDGNEPMEIIPLSRALGAELRGVDTAGAVSDREVAAIRAAWNEHHVILFRDCQLTPARHIAFLRGSARWTTTPRRRMTGWRATRNFSR